MKCVFNTLIVIEPRGKDRPRFWNGKIENTDATKNWEAAAAMGFSAVWNQPPLEGALGIQIAATFTLPEGIDGEFMTRAPDVDNIEKIVLDALVKAKVIANDRTVVSSNTIKTYGPKGCVKVTLYAYEKGDEVVLF